MNEEYVGGSIFKDIRTDERVTPDLYYCLYCKVSQTTKLDGGSFAMKDIDYKIPLDCINGAVIKQCPACKTIYILGDPTK